MLSQLLSFFIKFLFVEAMVAAAYFCIVSLISNKYQLDAIIDPNIDVRKPWRLDKGLVRDLFEMSLVVVLLYFGYSIAVTIIVVLLAVLVSKYLVK